MRIYLLAVGLFLTLTLSGCATTEKVPDSEIAEFKNRTQLLEAELKQKQAENIQLKEKIAELDKVSLRMPTGKDIQTALKNAGFYTGEIDGQIGSQTKEAIAKFQEANGLNPDGVVGSRTWVTLSKYLETKPE